MHYLLPIHFTTTQAKTRHGSQLETVVLDTGKKIYRQLVVKYLQYIITINRADKIYFLTLRDSVHIVWLGYELRTNGSSS